MFIIIYGFQIDNINKYIIEYFETLEKYKENKVILLIDPLLNVNLELLNILLPDYLIYIYEDGSINIEKFMKQIKINKITDFQIYKYDLYRSMVWCLKIDKNFDDIFNYLFQYKNSF